MSGPAASPTLRVEAVDKVYASSRGAVRAIGNVSFDVAQNEFVSLVGPSGCGKSTVLKMVAGVLAVSHGRILLNGKEVRGPTDGLGMVFQSPLLLEWRTVLGNVLLPTEARGRSRTGALERARALLKMVDLEGFQHHYPNELSGGMRQRVSICRALVYDPTLLLMDEPFGALDALTRDDMAMALSRLHQETRKTVLFVTHSIEEAVFLSDRVIVMTGRPGTVAVVVPIDLPRPRRDAVRFDQRFAEYKRVIRDVINARKTGLE